MRLIDADALEILEYLEEFPTGQLDKEWNDAVRCVNSYVANAPTIDAVPVVRCKDCKWCIAYAASPLIKWCNQHGTHFKNNDFCNYGERRDA